MKANVEWPNPDEAKKEKTATAQQTKEHHCTCEKSGKYWYCDHYVCSKCGAPK